MVCKNCGNQVSDTDSVCCKCGKTINQSKAKQKSNKLIIVVVAVILALIAGIATLLVMKASVNKEKTVVDDSSVTVTINGDIDEIFKRGYLQYLDKDKSYVLSRFSDYEEYGEFEGADFYKVDNDAFGFDYITNKCVAVSSDFIEAFPDAFGNNNDIITKKEFEDFIGYSMEIITESEASDRQTPYLCIYEDDFYVLVGCDENGNIRENDWCEVVLKETVVEEKAEDDIPEENKSDEEKTKTQPSTKTEEQSSAIKQQNIETSFHYYTSDFNKTIDTIRSEYDSALQWLETDRGLDWYRLGNKQRIGFAEVVASGADRENDYGGRFVAVQVPIWDVYPDIHTVAILDKNAYDAEHQALEGDCLVVPLNVFKEYVNTDVEFISSSSNQYESPYLSYNHDDINVVVFCDESGNVKLHNYDYSFCIFSIS